MVYSITQIEGLVAIEEQWTSLHRKMVFPTVFQSYEFVLASWDNILRIEDGNRLYCLVSCNNKTKSIELIMPCYIDNKGVLRFINDLHSDYCDGLYLSNEHLFGIVKDILYFVKKNREIRHIRLVNFRGDAPLFHNLYGICKNSISYAMYISSHIVTRSNEVGVQFEYLNSKDRNQLRTIQKRAQEYSCRICNIDNSTFPEKEILLLKKKLIEANIRKDEFYSGELHQVAKALYNAGLMDILLLWDKQNQLVAISTLLRNSLGANLMQWIVMNSTKESNLTHTLLAILHHAETGGSIFDFGRGGYDYKLNNFQPDIQSLFCLEIPMSKRGYYRAVRNLIFHNLKKILKYIIQNK